MRAIDHSRYGATAELVADAIRESVEHGETVLIARPREAEALTRMLYDEADYYEYFDAEHMTDAIGRRLEQHCFEGITIDGEDWFVDVHCEEQSDDA